MFHVSCIFIRAENIGKLDFRNYMVLSFLRNVSWIPEKDAKHSSSESIQHFRKIQRKKNSEVAAISFEAIQLLEIGYRILQRPA